MTYNYKAFVEDEPDPIDEYKIDNRSRKIKELVTINITVEMEKSKYDSKKKKYKEPIPQKIAKLFE